MVFQCHPLYNYYNCSEGENKIIHGEKYDMKKTETNMDVEAIKQTVLDYIEGFYYVEPSRVKQSVHPELTKFGFIRMENV